MIAYRRGHNFQSIGSSCYIDEVTEAEKVKNEVKRLLNIYSKDSIDVSPPNMVSSKDLNYGVTKANNSKADLFFSIHFNANKKTENPVGCEVWTYNTILPQADRVCKKLGQLGFKNRGVKHSKSLYELKNTKMKAMIIEVCFVDSKADIDNYINVGYQKVAKAIVEGILDISIDDKCPHCGK